MQTTIRRTWALAALVLLLYQSGISPQSAALEQPAALQLNEYMPAPNEVDWNGDGSANERDEWVELINLGPAAIDLEGWQLDDGAGGGAPVRLAAGTQVAPGGLVVVYLGKALLNNGGDRLQLLAPGGAVVDETSYNDALAGVSHGRLPDGEGLWQAMTAPSPGALNQTLLSTATHPVSQTPSLPIASATPTGLPVATVTSSASTPSSTVLPATFTPSPAATHTTSPTPSSTATQTVVPTLPDTATATRTTPTLSATPTAPATATATRTTPTLSATPTAPATATATRTATPTPSPSPTATRTTPTLSATPTAPATATATRTAIPTSSSTATQTAVPTLPATATATPTASPSPAPATVRLNEYLAVPEGVDWNGDGSADERDEWVELINLGPAAIDLEGWQLDDGAGGGAPVRLAAGTQVAPGGLVVVYLGKVLLNNGGDRLQLLAPGGAVVDETSYSEALAGVSHGRLPDGEGGWVAHTLPTPGEPNRAPDPTATPASSLTDTPSPTGTATPTSASTNTPTPTRTARPTRTVKPTRTPTPLDTVLPASSATSDHEQRQQLPAATTAIWKGVEGSALIRLNEYLAVPEGVDWNGDGSADERDEWVELINLGPAAIDLEGWQLDDGAGGGAPVRLAAGTQVAPGGLVVVYLGKALLNNGGDRLQLLAPGGAVVDETSYSDALAGVSHGRLPDGEGGWVAHTLPTPGELNGPLSSDNRFTPTAPTAARETYSTAVVPVLSDSYSTQKEEPESTGTDHDRRLVEAWYRRSISPVPVSIVTPEIATAVSETQRLPSPLPVELDAATDPLAGEEIPSTEAGGIAWPVLLLGLALVALVVELLRT